MKKILIFVMVLATMIGFYSCQKEPIKVVLNPKNVKSPVLQGVKDGAVYTFTKAIKDSTIQFTWNPANYGFKAAVSYFIQIAKQGTNFANAENLGHTNSVDTLKVTVSNFNNTILTMESSPGSFAPLNLDLRVIAIVNPNVDTAFSASVKITVNPYYVPIHYPQLYVPGAYQGWNPGTADSIGSIKGNGIYEGYIYMNAPGEFKFTGERDWNGTNYGAGASAGLLSTNSNAGNLSVADSGYFKFNVNTTALTWTGLKTTWSIIGSAFGNGTTDAAMTFSPATGLWTFTANLNQGNFEFRANDTSTLTYGSNANDGTLQEGGSNITIPAAGNYTVVLDLRNTIYRYKLTKN